MAVSLVKGQKVDLVKTSGEKLEKFCVKVGWGAIEEVVKGFFSSKKKVVDVDLDLSAIMVDKDGKMIDHVYSPEYNNWLRSAHPKFPLGKLRSKDKALNHSGDDLGVGGGDDFSEVISVDMAKLDSKVDEVFFFLNIYLKRDQSFDFSHIPFANIMMYEGTPSNVQKKHLSFDVVTNESFHGKKGLILGKLYKRNDQWKFAAIGDPTNDELFKNTIERILRSYV
ncbi:MAG: TerD family protein [Hyphomicrobiales bacterium]